MPKVVLSSVVLGALFLAPSADAAIPSVFGGDVACTVNGTDNVRECGSTAPRSTTESWDGTPIDVNVAFPPDPGSGDGNYPLIMVFHGYGGGKIGFGAASSTAGLRRWTSRGYAVFTMTDRGFKESCGSAASQAADPTGCANAYVRLIDNRYEVRDAQFLAGELADEGLIDPQRIGATGGSYGGGMSMALAALKNRVALPNGTLVPWTSPVNSDPMRIAAATPEVPWTDLAYSLTPNGHNLDFVADSPYRGRFGVMKESFQNGLYVAGQSAPGFYAPTGQDPSADITGWRARLLAGEPYDGDPAAQAVLDEITKNHSSYYIDHSEAPAPLMISNGFTDDLFPVDEAVRFYNRTTSQYPNTPIALNAGDFGHMRAQGKADVTAALAAREDAWMDYYVKGTGSTPPSNVEAFTETCPSGAPSGGPFTASSWGTLALGEVRFSSASSKTIRPSGGSDSVSAVFNPVTGPGACATAPGGNQGGVATYRLPAAKGGGYTLLGSPTIVATIKNPGANSQLAARLLDVDTHGTPVGGDDTEVLVARQLYRPQVGTGRRVIQLHPGAWHFDDGHVPKLELLPRDNDSPGGFLGGYGRRSDGQGTIKVSHLSLTLPVREQAGAGGGAVKLLGRLPAPCSSQLAPGFASRGRITSTFASGKLRVRRGRVGLRATAVPGDHQCLLHARVAGVRKLRHFVFANGFAKISGGSTRTMRLKLTRWARRHLLGERRRVRAQVALSTPGIGTSRGTRVLLLPKR